MSILEFKAQATELGMDSLVEIHDDEDLEKALAGGAELIGINNRNLRDFTVDIETTFRLKAKIPDTIPVISESGLSSVEDLQALKQGGIDGALIGESLMRAGQSSDMLAGLRG